MAQWNLDGAHSSADFTVRHMMFTNVRGGFNVIDATLEFDQDNPEQSVIEATIDVSSIDTGVEDRDNHLRSADFFNVDEYPTMTFKSTNVEATSAESAKVTGDLTIRDVTREITLDVTFTGKGQGPWGNTRAGFEGKTTINREDFGLTWNQALESGGVLVGQEVKLNLDVQFVLETEEKAETA